MLIQQKDRVPHRERPGLTSYFLLQAGDTGTGKLAVTLVEVAPGGRQLPHSHAEEQVYFVVEGAGTMEVDGEQATVSAGDLIHIPSHTTHGICNQSRSPLIYLSAATPAMDIEAAYDQGHLQTVYYEQAATGGDHT